jgi:hypothetical protein
MNRSFQSPKSSNAWKISFIQHVAYCKQLIIFTLSNFVNPYPHKIVLRFYETPAPLKAGRDYIGDRHRTFALKLFRICGMTGQHRFLI